MRIAKFLTFLLCLPVSGALAQTTPPANNNGQTNFTYKKINPQLSYAFIVNKPGANHPQEGDQVLLNMQSICANRIMYSTAQAFKGKPGIFGVAKPAFKGDIIEAITLMTPGDSIVCITDAVELFKNSKVKVPEFIKAGDKMQYFIKLVSIKTKEQVQKEQQDAFMKQLKEQQAKQAAAAARQLVKDNKTLQQYFLKNKIKPEKTASGLYYSITREGEGDKPVAGDTVTMSYTGRLTDGTEFDSNVDTAFHHTQPFVFVLGRGSVIKGWDEGIALLKPGSKAMLYIPSTLAYGAQSRPGSTANPKGIPANAILIFDLELVKSVHPVPVAPVMKTDSTRKVVSDTLSLPGKMPAEEQKQQ